MNWKKIIGWLIALAALGFIGFSVFGPKEKAKAPTVETTTVKEENIVETLSTTGTLQPNATQNGFGTGLVSEVNFAVGDKVAKDDVIVRYLDGTTITATIDGTITALNVKKDQVDLNTQTGQPSVTIDDLGNLKVAILLSKSDANLVKVDQPVTLTSGNTTYTGKVSALDPVATTTTGATGATTALGGTITFDTPPTGLFAGFEIDADITTNTAENALTMPIETLVYDKENKPYVYIVKNDKAKKVEIETGIQSDTKVQIIKGLEKGQKVIISPADSLKNGTAVTVK
ncbi:MAG: HlyD family efflux transporter periplasmic adaptor subunit [Carnobacterium sp.]|jgi:HlyD family secretion protein|uniref:Efflux transporter, RND family, MFP subunit n=1 Tax=Carnobacterium maltaromaticum LMA28 TaxID=1234679 RepID=K8E2E4_CARML|nr:HlyD family efflux transporter periplasmic adaptor subunit [Carnobacterium maltaromaticum]AOA01100.1 RND transporter [Carnobacterium maltaromaticum]KRN60557.1 RND family efflux transporter MFP subunit [Carnobacterium maltaromaticum DSM 20342]MBC9789641.1 HlyD family efflux transporter periplasmic adaptor subunit [Carnobacterium maltaromaticum]MCI1820144.1 HlyD family efflux transporter periplasmic adaptor subunit [Carnobacterium maltaromaticum]MDW5523609.1 HlyD family efflux transporter per